MLVELSQGQLISDNGVELSQGELEYSCFD